MEVSTWRIPHRPPRPWWQSAPGLNFKTLAGLQALDGSESKSFQFTDGMVGSKAGFECQIAASGVRRFDISITGFRVELEFVLVDHSDVIVVTE